MAQLNILRYPDPRLHTVARPVAEVDARIRQLVDDMIETMYAAEGIGLAATQVDVHERVIVMDMSETRDQPLVLINPEITWRSDEMVMAEEGCLSVPAIYDKVQRHARVNVRALDRDGQAFELEADGPAGGVRAARDGPPARQGLRRLPEPAQAQPHPQQAAEAAARGAAWRLIRRPRRRACASPSPARRSSRARALQQLLQAGHRPPLVLTQPDRPAGRGLKLQASAVKQLALAHGLPVAQPRSLRLDGKFPQDAAGGASRRCRPRGPTCWWSRPTG